MLFQLSKNRANFCSIEYQAGVKLGTTSGIETPLKT